MGLFQKKIKRTARSITLLQTKNFLLLILVARWGHVIWWRLEAGNLDKTLILRVYARELPRIVLKLIR